MLRISEQTDNGSIELVLAGRIDTGDVETLQTAILSVLKRNNYLNLNFAKVEYLSTAALRALLIGHKTAVSKGGNMKLTQVQPQVMKTLQISVFTNILEIEQIH